MPWNTELVVWVHTVAVFFFYSLCMNFFNIFFHCFKHISEHSPQVGEKKIQGGCSNQRATYWLILHSSGHVHYLLGNLLACDMITDCSGVSTIHCTTCQQKALRWSLQRLAYDLWALSIKPLVNTWHLVSCYHCKGWGMSVIHWATYQHLIPRLSLQRLGHERYPLNHLGYHCKRWGMYTNCKATWQPVL